jgi:subtilisin family serine protease
MVEAIRWCIDERMDVVNLSLELTPSEDDFESLQAVLAEALEAGMCLVAPTGNAGGPNISYPASSPFVIGVGALGDTRVVQDLLAFAHDREGAKHFAFDSSEFVPWFSNFGEGVDLLAPGSAIASTVPQAAGSYARFSGTSMAAPFVSGACALLIQAGGRTRGPARVQRITRALRQTARRLEGISTNVQGRGVLDVPRALAFLEP